MKKYWPALLLVLGICVTLAAGLGHLHRESCGANTGKWRFVEDPTSEHDAGVLTATWSSGDSCTASPSSR